MSFKDYYQVLGIDRDASQQEIKKAFRQLALRHHPDHNRENPQQAEETFKGINEAYEVLGNEVRRRQYDYLTSQLEQRFGNQSSEILEKMLRDLATLSSNPNIILRGKPGGCRRGYGRSCGCSAPWRRENYY
jgi:curved DNA-binding protein CbpA